MSYFPFIIALACSGSTEGAVSTLTQGDSLKINISKREPTHLDLAISYTNTREWMNAIESFLNAISSGDLNNAGKALSYWNIAECWGKLGNEDQVIGALFNFTLVAQAVLEERDVIRYTVTSDGDFVEKFDLVGKLDFARAYINYTWAIRSNVYGKSRDNPIIAHNTQEANFFVSIIESQCANKCDTQRSLLHKDGILVQLHTERIIVHDQTTNQFFIVIP